MSIGWTQERERGSTSLVQFMVWLLLRFGWGIGRVLLAPLTTYFFLTSRRARAASRAYLARVFGRPARWHEVWRHFFTFSATLLDRPFLLTRCIHDYRLEISGMENLARLWTQKRGCIIVGSHLGSFEVLRALAEENPHVKVRPVMFEGEGGTASVFRSLNPRVAEKIISVGSLGTVMQVKEALDQADMVGILGDRISTGDKAVQVQFLGAAADFPAGPCVMSTLLETPIVLCFGLYVRKRHYEIHFEAFADGARLPREGRDAAIAAMVQRYAARLEAQCRRRPYNWFNFYDFWAKS